MSSKKSKIRNKNQALLAKLQLSAGALTGLACCFAALSASAAKGKVSALLSSPNVVTSAAGCRHAIVWPNAGLTGAWAQYSASYAISNGRCAGGLTISAALETSFKKYMLQERIRKPHPDDIHLLCECRLRLADESALPDTHAIVEGSIEDGLEAARAYCNKLSRPVWTEGAAVICQKNEPGRFSSLASGLTEEVCAARPILPKVSLSWPYLPTDSFEEPKYPNWRQDMLITWQKAHAALSAPSFSASPAADIIGSVNIGSVNMRSVDVRSALYAGGQSKMPKTFLYFEKGESGLFSSNCLSAADEEEGALSCYAAQNSHNPFEEEEESYAGKRMDASALIAHIYDGMSAELKPRGLSASVQELSVARKDMIAFFNDIWEDVVVYNTADAFYAMAPEEQQRLAFKQIEAWITQQKVWDAAIQTDYPAPKYQLIIDAMNESLSQSQIEQLILEAQQPYSPIMTIYSQHSPVSSNSYESLWSYVLDGLCGSQAQAAYPYWPLNMGGQIIYDKGAWGESVKSVWLETFEELKAERGKSKKSDDEN